MTEPLFIIGCGGFGREVRQIAAAAGWTVANFIDDDPSPDDLDRVRALNSRTCGGVSELVGQTKPFHAVIAIGDPVGRRSVAKRLSGTTARFPILVHPASSVAPDAMIGPGCVVAAGARLSTNVRTGKHVHIDQNATVGHDSTLGDFSRLNPQACISGSVSVGAGAVVGASATVLAGLEIGEDAIVGAAACVVRHVPARTTVKGIPAR